MGRLWATLALSRLRSRCRHVAHHIGPAYSLVSFSIPDTIFFRIQTSGVRYPHRIVLIGHVVLHLYNMVLAYQSRRLVLLRAGLSQNEVKSSFLSVFRTENELKSNEVGCLQWQLRQLG